MSEQPKHTMFNLIRYFYGLNSITFLLLLVTLHPAVLAESVHRTPYLNSETTRQFSHLVWQKHLGDGISIALLDTVNATNKSSYNIKGLDGFDIELRNVPQQLEPLFSELINRSHFLTINNDRPEYFLQFQIREFKSRFSLTNSDDPFSLGLAYLDKSWSKMNGDDGPSSVALVLSVFNNLHQPLIHIVTKASLDSCEVATNPMTFGPGEFQSFYSQLATTTTGQTLIAAVNRSLDELSSYFQHLPIRGKVIEVQENELILNLTDSTVFKGDRLTIKQFNQQMNKYQKTGSIEIESVQEDFSIAHALTLKTANIRPGDQVELGKVVQKRKWTSAAGGKVNCIKPTMWNRSAE